MHSGSTRIPSNPRTSFRSPNAPADLAAHRRLAAALANQGDLISACEEYGRYIDVALSHRDTRRAWLELTYGRETLGDLPQLLAIADRVAAAQGGAMPTPPPPVRAAATPSTIPAPRPTTSASASWTPPAKPATPDPRPAPISTKPSPAAANGRPTIIGASDARAPEAALDAARRLLAIHKLAAASDVLLDLIGAGFKDREAQRLLIEVNCEIGMREVAREKCALLGAVYRLDGQGSIAEDVERLALIL